MEWADVIGSRPAAAAWNCVPIQSYSCSLRVFHMTWVGSRYYTAVTNVVITRSHDQNDLFSPESLSFSSDVGPDAGLRIVYFHDQSQQRLLQRSAWPHQVWSSVTLHPRYHDFRRVGRSCDDSGDQLHLIALESWSTFSWSWPRSWPPCDNGLRTPN